MILQLHCCQYKVCKHHMQFICTACCCSKRGTPVPGIVELPDPHCHSTEQDRLATERKCSASRQHCQAIDTDFIATEL